MNFRNLILVAMVFAVAAFAQNTLTDSAYQVTYAANLGIGDSVINITNTGTSSLTGYGSGTTTSVGGSLCANVYVFTPDEQIVACCSCPVTPNGLVSLSAQKDLIVNTLTQKTAPTSIVIKLVATNTTAGCNGANAAGLSRGALVNGMAAWGTKLHANNSPTGGYAVTEVPFTQAALSDQELARLNYTCGIVQFQGSGNGVCSSCRLNGLGAVKQ